MKLLVIWIAFFNFVVTHAKVRDFSSLSHAQFWEELKHADTRQNIAEDLAKQYAQNHDLKFAPWEPIVEEVLKNIDELLNNPILSAWSKELFPWLRDFSTIMIRYSHQKYEYDEKTGILSHFPPATLTSTLLTSMILTYFTPTLRST